MSIYIKSYNLLGIIVCIYALYLTGVNTRTHDETFGILLCQAFFLFEIINIYLKKSNSKLFPTMLQLASRVFILGICLNIKYTPYFTVMCLAWYVTDLIRYCYYLSRNNVFKWLRYNMFIALYPIGVGMELKIVSYLLDYAVWRYFVIAIFMAYIPGFGFLYFHMLKQRRSISIKRVKKRDIRKERAQ